MLYALSSWMSGQRCEAQNSFHGIRVNQKGSQQQSSDCYLDVRWYRNLKTASEEVNPATWKWSNLVEKMIIAAQYLHSTFPLGTICKEEAHGEVGLLTVPLSSILSNSALFIFSFSGFKRRIREHIGGPWLMISWNIPWETLDVRMCGRKVIQNCSVLLMVIV